MGTRLSTDSSGSSREGHAADAGLAPVNREQLLLLWPAQRMLLLHCGAPKKHNQLAVEQNLNLK